MKKTIALVLTLCLLMMTAAFGVAETADDSADAAAFMDSIKGTYEALFPVITVPEYDQIWLDACAAVLGEGAAPETAEMLKAACNGTVYGQEAIDAFGDGSDGAQFDCLFINGVSTLTFNGNTISGADESGKQVFSHDYAYVGKLVLGGMMDANFRRAVSLASTADSPLAALFGRPITLILLALTLVTLVGNLPAVRRRLSGRKKE